MPNHCAWAWTIVVAIVVRRRDSASLTDRQCRAGELIGVGVTAAGLGVVSALKPLLLGYLGLPNPAACFHGFAEAVERSLLG